MELNSAEDMGGHVHAREETHMYVEGEQENAKMCQMDMNW